MRGVIDESVPRLLARLLVERGIAVSAFPREWKGLQNGELLDRIEVAGFDYLITCDANLRYQQNFGNRSVSIVVLPFQLLRRLLPIVPKLVDALRKLERRSIMVVVEDGSFKSEPLA